MSKKRGKKADSTQHHDQKQINFAVCTDREKERVNIVEMRNRKPARF